jgi:hypothetical protein
MILNVDKTLILYRNAEAAKVWGRKSGRRSPTG